MATKTAAKPVEQGRNLRPFYANHTPEQLKEAQKLRDMATKLFDADFEAADITNGKN